VQNINKEAMSPQDSATKVARELDLNVHFIKRAAEAINIVLHHNHFKKHAATKGEDFPIVDATKVAEEIFGKTSKTANELKSEYFSPIDHEAEVPNFNKAFKDEKFKAAFDQICKSPEKNDTFETSLAGLLDKSGQYLKRLEKDTEEAFTKLSALQFETTNTFCNLVNSFAKEAAYRTSFGEFESQCYSLYGDKALPYIDLMHKEASIPEERGVHDDKYKLFTNCKEAQQMGKFLKLANEVKQAELEAKAAKTAWVEATNQYSKIASDYKKAKDSKKGKGSVQAQEKKDVDMLEKLKQEQESEGDPVKKEMSKRQANKVIEKAEKWKAAADYMDSFLGGVGDKITGESKFKSSVPSTSPKDNLDRKLMLQELAVTDPILSSVDPHKVVSSYEQMLHLAPELAKEKELVRAQLRQMVSSQAIGPFESQQLIDANTKFMNQKMYQEGQLQPPKQKL